MTQPSSLSMGETATRLTADEDLDAQHAFTRETSVSVDAVTGRITTLTMAPNHYGRSTQSLRDPGDPTSARNLARNQPKQTTSLGSPSPSSSSASSHNATHNYHTNNPAFGRIVEQDDHLMRRFRDDPVIKRVGNRYLAPSQQSASHEDAIGLVEEQVLYNRKTNYSRLTKDLVNGWRAISPSVNVSYAMIGDNPWEGLGTIAGGASSSCG